MERALQVEMYGDFWARSNRIPLLGFDVGGFFPVKRYSIFRNLPRGVPLRPESLDPGACLEDYAGFHALSSSAPDSMLKGVSPISAVPWLESMLGATPVLEEDGIWARERKISWDGADGIGLRTDDPWFRTYMSFLEALDRQAAGRYPVGIPILRGVTDLMGVLRGHSESVVDCIDEPERAARLAGRCADALIRLIGRHEDAVSPVEGGYAVEQFALWAPGRIARLQEDASALYSPGLYREFILEQDRRIAESFPYSVIHLHSSSLFLLHEILTIDAIDCFQINKDVGGMSVEEMLPYLVRVQEEGKCLLIRGMLDADDLSLIGRHLLPQGLYLQCVTEPSGTAAVREAFDRVWRG